MNLNNRSRAIAVTPAQSLLLASNSLPPLPLPTDASFFRKNFGDNFSESSAYDEYYGVNRTDGDDASGKTGENFIRIFPGSPFYSFLGVLTDKFHNRGLGNIRLMQRLSTGGIAHGVVPPPVGSLKKCCRILKTPNRTELE